MAAKEAIFELLKDCSLSNEDLTENILTCVRQHKLGTVPIARYAKEALKLDNLDSERFGSTVESHVRAIVDVARSTDTHSRGSQNRGAVDDDVTVDLDSDNLDEDECIEERDSDMARGSAKAKSLARAAIAEADHQEKGDNEPVGDGKKPDDNASTEDVRPTSGDAYDEATVSAHSQTLKGEVRTMNDRSICERRSCTRNILANFWKVEVGTLEMGCDLDHSREAQWPIGYGVGLRIKRSSVRIRPWPLRWVLGQGSLLPLSQGEAFTLASISYLAILVKYMLAKKKKKKKVIAKRSLRGRSPRFSRGVRGHAPPENFENRDCQIRIF